MYLWDDASHGKGMPQREVFEQDQGLSKDATPRSGIPNLSHRPYAAEIINFHNLDYLRSTVSTGAGPGHLGGKHLPRWNKRLHWELKVKANNFVFAFPHQMIHTIVS